MANILAKTVVSSWSPLGRETWKPAWVAEDRVPEFMGGGIGVQFGGKKYLWGNIPALDILRLESNEGKDYAENLCLLFAASGDLRNLIMTINGLPDTYDHSIDITLNDMDFDIVARNIILLLIALTVEQVNEAADCILHLWYSAHIREAHIDILESRVRPLIEDVCNKINDKSSNGLFGKTWKFKQSSLRVVLEKPSWIRLASFVNRLDRVSNEQAKKLRTDTTLAESRKDYRDRHMCFLPISYRIPFVKFREDGILLPFGQPRHEFQFPNPTFFRDDGSWNMKDSADPLHGWSLEDVVNTSSGPAEADLYGKLFYYVREALQTFLLQLSSMNASLNLFQMDASLLPEHLEKDSFSRIEVSNISDSGWLGIHGTLGLIMPLLQSPLKNPHATLITLFMNAIEESMTDQDRLRKASWDSPATKTLMKYLPPTRRLSSRYDPDIIKFNFCRELVTNYDDIFNQYLRKLKVFEFASLFNVEMKKKQTIMDKSPYRLKLRPGQPGAQDEFERQLASGLTGKERYLEWRRISLTAKQPF
ncbi:hypothetical protein N7478_008105 [Penicillium angulare]|uniref:uncharacterized protein n=1 Tax=Penicillium angulare TaxID=116970 RepID=UPI0025408F9E|nr:uncharacterized protein N7478_008105 [Penicillium angulare]KAJ5272980.1 hypothetical protein N7478_008105 [Penicillium angulare]